MVFPSYGRERECKELNVRRGIGREPAAQGLPPWRVTYHRRAARGVDVHGEPRVLERWRKAQHCGIGEGEAMGGRIADWDCLAMRFTL